MKICNFCRYLLFLPNADFNLKKLPPPPPPPWFPPKPSSILNQAGPAQDPAGPGPGRPSIANRQFNRQYNRQYNTQSFKFLVLTVYRYVYVILEKGIVPNWWQGIYDQLLPGIINRVFVIFNVWNKSVNSWTCQLYYYAFPILKQTQFKHHTFLREKWLWLIGFGLV